MQKISPEDRRIFQRFPLNLSLRFRDLNANKWGLVRTHDISARGIGLVAEKELAPRLPLEMWLPNPDTGQSYYTKGVVVWSKMFEPDRYRAGVILEKTDLMGLSQFLRQH